MKNQRFFFTASALVVLLAFAHLCRGLAAGGESLWDGSFWSGGNADDDTVGWGDEDDSTDIWGEIGGSGGDGGLLPLNLPPALTHLRARAEKGDPAALRDIGMAFHHGDFGLAVDYGEALRWYEMAASKGSVPAMANLSVILIDNLVGSEGEERDRNLAKAYPFLRRAAEAGNAPAQYNLGMYLQLGRGVEANEDEAIEWLRKAGEQGRPDACDRLSLIFHDRGDAARAAEWFGKGAEAGHPRATFNLGVYYESGQGGLPEDQRKAFSHFLKSARLGQPAGMLATGKRYLSGRGCRIDPSRAKKWLLEAKAHGAPGAEELLAQIPPEVQPFDDRPLRVTAEKLIGDFGSDPEAAAAEYEGRTLDLSGGNTSIDMHNDKTSISVAVPGSTMRIECDIPPDGSGSAVVNYGTGMVLRAQFAGFSPEKGAILLDNGKTIPEE